MAACGRLMESILFGVKPGDPVIVMAALGVLVITGIAAAYVPVAGAASVDPMQALRSE